MHKKSPEVYVKDDFKMFPAEQGEHCALSQGLHAQFGPPVLKRQGIQSDEEDPWATRAHKHRADPGCRKKT